MLSRAEADDRMGALGLRQFLSERSTEKYLEEASQDPRRARSPKVLAAAKKVIRLQDLHEASERGNDRFYQFRKVIETEEEDKAERVSVVHCPPEEKSSKELR